MQAAKHPAVACSAGKESRGASGADRRRAPDLHTFFTKYSRDFGVGRAFLDADSSPIERRDGLRRVFLRHHERLSVIEQDTGEPRLKTDLAAERPRRLANQDVDPAALQCGESRGRGERDELDLFSVAERRRRHGPAEIGVHAGPASGRVFLRESRDAFAHAAAQGPARLDRTQDLARVAGGHAQPGDAERQTRANRSVNPQPRPRHVGL